AKTSLADIYVTQVYWLVVGGLMGILVAMIDYRNFERLAYFVYVGGILLLMLVFVLASNVRSASRWIRFGSFAFQPSEFMKIPVILAVARFLANDPKTDARSLTDLAPAFLLCALPMGLVVMQPGVGSSLIYVMCTGSRIART